MTWLTSAEELQATTKESRVSLVQAASTSKTSQRRRWSLPSHQAAEKGADRMHELIRHSETDRQPEYSFRSKTKSVPVISHKAAQGVWLSFSEEKQEQRAPAESFMERQFCFTCGDVWVKVVAPKHPKTKKRTRSAKGLRLTVTYQIIRSHSPQSSHGSTLDPAHRCSTEVA